jgi:hypothetical protein
MSGGPRCHSSGATQARTLACCGARQHSVPVRHNGGHSWRVTGVGPAVMTSPIYPGTPEKADRILNPDLAGGRLADRAQARLTDDQ